MKKAQGLSLNVIIIAAIALIVLVVLVAIFTGRMGDWTSGLRKVETRYCGDVPAGVQGSSMRGTPTSSSTGCADYEREIPGVYEDVSVTQVCCVQE